MFPGGHLEEGESLKGAASRELLEEAGLNVDSKLLTKLCVLDGKNRDPRPGTRVSHVFTKRVTSSLLEQARADTDAKSVHFISLHAITPEMIGFDHYKAIEILRENLNPRHTIC